MTFQSLSEIREFKSTGYERTEADILRFKNGNKELQGQPTSINGSLAKAEDRLNSIIKNSKCAILIRKDAQSKIYYLLDLDVIATVPVDKSNVAPYRNALDLTNVSSFETLTNRQIAKEISVIFDIIDLWHRPKAWKEVRSKIGSHYKSQRDG
ncbi:hypothetical protein IKG06_02315 [Candidatus Saccharibacteria bacterium]|nr:hypothetical protein [Candidatus Saccharibacteria bacterium]